MSPPLVSDVQFWPQGSKPVLTLQMWVAGSPGRLPEGAGTDTAVLTHLPWVTCVL